MKLLQRDDYIIYTGNTKYKVIIFWRGLNVTHFSQIHFYGNGKVGINNHTKLI